MKARSIAPFVAVMGACSANTCGGRSANAPEIGGGAKGSASSIASSSVAPSTSSATIGAKLVLVADVDWPGNSVRFDYQDVDLAKGYLVAAHMNDASVVIARLDDGSPVKVFPGIPVARGVAVAEDLHRVFVTSSPKSLVVLDDASLTEIARVTTGNGPDGVAWDANDAIVAVSDQHDGAISLLESGGQGARAAIALGSETGNVVFDPSRGCFWITVVGATPPDRLIAIDPIAKKSTTSIALPGCSGAHGLRLHPDGKSALVACEENAKVVRVDLAPPNAITIAESGEDPDVLAIDPGLLRLYVAAESGDLRVYDLAEEGLVEIDRERPGDASHTVAVDPRTHRLFFPLPKGASGTPILRIMKPEGA